MSLIYLIFIEKALGGIFSLGRFVDLFQCDVVVVLLFLIALYARRVVIELREVKQYERLRWNRLKDR